MTEIHTICVAKTTNDRAIIISRGKTCGKVNKGLFPDMLFIHFVNVSEKIFHMTKPIHRYERTVMPCGTGECMIVRKVQNMAMENPERIMAHT